MKIYCPDRSPVIGDIIKRIDERYKDTFKVINIEGSFIELERQWNDMYLSKEYGHITIEYFTKHLFISKNKMHLFCLV